LRRGFYRVGQGKGLLDRLPPCGAIRTVTLDAGQHFRIVSGLGSCQVEDTLGVRGELLSKP
jgi:hypothetical protein